MRSVSGAAGRVLYGNIPFAPFELNGIIGTGQSLNAGSGAPASSTVQPFANVKLFDSRGTAAGYIIADPQAATLSLVPLTALMRPDTPSGNYAENILGEGPTIEFANCLTALAKTRGFAEFNTMATCTGLTSAPMSQINKPNIPYNAGIYEVQCAAPGPSNGGLAAKLGYRFYGLLFTALDHGETDSINFAASNVTDPAAYGVPLSGLQGDYETDARDNGSLTVSYLPHIPMVISLQNTCPGSLTGRAIVTQAMTDAAKGAPDLFVVACGKYQMMAFALDDFHYSEYRPIGDKEAQFGLKYFLEHKLAEEQNRDPDPTAWAPFWIESAEVAGSVATVHWHVPVPPMVRDTTTVTQPHTAGQWSMWAAGFGLEAWDAQLDVTDASDTTPIVLTLAGAHGLADGDTYAAEGILGNTAANGVWTVTATGHGPGQLALNGSVGNGAYTAGGIGFAPIGITSIVMAGSDVTINLARAPVGPHMQIAYAEHLDGPYHPGGGSNPSRRGNLRDSDPFTPPPPLVTLSPQALYANWAIPFLVTVNVP